MTKFIQIAANNDGLYALDADGYVWAYYPATKRRFAFWGQLTDHQADPERLSKVAAEAET